MEPEPKLWTKVEPEPKRNNFGSATLKYRALVLCNPYLGAQRVRTIQKKVDGTVQRIGIKGSLDRYLSVGPPFKV